jgi:hypothetical protein
MRSALIGHSGKKGSPIDAGFPSDPVDFPMPDGHHRTIADGIQEFVGGQEK